MFVFVALSKMYFVIRVRQWVPTVLQ